MSYAYDDQLIDAVGVRRHRLCGALMFGRDRLRREWSDRLRTVMWSAVLTALIAAGCVATSFIQHLLATDPSLQRNRQSVTPTSLAPASGSSSGPAAASPSGSPR